MIKSQSDGSESLFQDMQNTKKFSLRNVRFIMLSKSQALRVPLWLSATFIIKAHSKVLKNVT